MASHTFAHAIGRIREVSVQTTPAGIPVANLVVEVRERSRRPDDDGWGAPMLLDVVAWRDVATACRSAVVGSGVAVTGSLSVRTWTPGDGIPRSRVEIVADTISFRIQTRGGLPE